MSRQSRDSDNFRVVKQGGDGTIHLSFKLSTQGPLFPPTAQSQVNIHSPKVRGKALSVIPELPKKFFCLVSGSVHCMQMLTVELPAMEHQLAQLCYNMP